MGNTTDPLISLIRQSPVQALIAATFLLVLFSWLVAFEERLRRLRERHRLIEMRTQLDELRSHIRRLEAQGQSLLVSFLNLPRSSSSLTDTPAASTSSTDTPAEKNPSIVPATDMQLVPESHEIAAHEKTRPETNSKPRLKHTIMYYADHPVQRQTLSFVLIFVSFLIVALAITIVGALVR